MIPYLGDFAEDATVYIAFNTFDSNDPSASVTITNLADADIMVHKDGGTTQIATDGATVAIDYDGITGNHLVTIDTSVHSDYAIGSDYHVRIEGTTVDGGTINAWIGHFSIENRFTASAVDRVLLALPNAAPDAAGGIPVSDAGGLDLDALNTAAVRLTAARAQAIDDWINGGRLDLILDIIAADTTTDIPALIATAQADLDTITGAAGALLDTTATSAQLVDDVWDEQLTGGTHNVSTSAGRRLRNIQDFGIYDLASVWVDEVAGGSSGTTDGEDGTVTNRSDDFDNAQTVAASVGLDRIHVQSGNSITLAATLNGYEVWGHLYTIALGGKDIGGTAFISATISGIGTGTAPEFVDCVVGTATVPPARFINCQFTTTLTVGSAGAYRLIDCKSGVAGAGAPTIDMGAGVGATTLELRDWRGGITLNNLASGDVVTLDGIFGTITLNGADAAVEIRGIYKALTNNLTGSPTVTATGVKGTDLVDVLADTNILQTEWADGGRLDLILDTAGAAGDPWSTALPGAYGAGTAGEILGDWKDAGRLDVILDAVSGGAATNLDVHVTDIQTE